MGESTFEVQRQYLYRFVDDHKADVFFFTPSNEEEHMKFFHSLDFSQFDREDGNAMCAEAEHLCLKGT